MCHHLSQNDAKRRKNGVKRHEIGAKWRKMTRKRRENNAKNAAPPLKIGGLDPSLYIYIHIYKLMVQLLISKGFMEKDI